jgi:hypothetical protein
MNHRKKGDVVVQKTFSIGGGRSEVLSHYATSTDKLFILFIIY